MNTITVTQLYEELTTSLGKKTAESLCSYVETKISKELEDQTKILATKEDVGLLKAETNELRLSTKEEFAAVRSEMANIKLELLVRIGELKADTIRWMFIFWIGQVATTFGLLVIFLKK